jgi:predicted RNA-binding Zn-ribbon protein involved in translation (DUF1610 family)
MGVNMATRTAIPIKEQDERLPYRLREKFMSATELALFRTLQNMAGKHYVVCPKVGLNEIFYIVRPNENVHFFNKIFRKHVDFLLCEPKSLQPAFGIELVKPVGKSETREADQFMEDLFLGAGLPLVHIQSSEKYSEDDLAELFQLAILKIKQTKSLRISGTADSVPQCPVCGKMMVLRMHRTGSDKGKRYYGCMDNPHCAGMIKLD